MKFGSGKGAAPFQSGIIYLGNDIVGHYVTTENYKLFYNMEGIFKSMETLAKVAQV